MGPDPREHDGPCDRAGSYSSEKEAIETGAPAEQLSGNEGQQRPNGAGAGEEQDGPQKNQVKLSTGAGVAQPRPESAAEMFAELTSSAPAGRCHQSSAAMTKT